MKRCVRGSTRNARHAKFVTLGSQRGSLAEYAYSTYTVVVAIEFDPTKNAANLRKHGVSLAEGDGVLNVPLALTIEDETTQGERRFATLGANVFGALMVVVWTQRDEVIRLISVREAEPKERRAYEEGT